MDTALMHFVFSTPITHNVYVLVNYILHLLEPSLRKPFLVLLYHNHLLFALAYYHQPKQKMMGKSKKVNNAFVAHQNKESLFLLFV